MGSRSGELEMPPHMGTFLNRKLPRCRQAAGRRVTADGGAAGGGACCLLEVPSGNEVTFNIMT